MLLIGIIVIILYSSYNKVRWEELKNIYRLGGISVLYSVILLYNSTNIIYIGKSLTIFNDLIVITPYSTYIKILILILTIIYIVIKNEYMKLNISAYSLNYSDYTILILINVLGMCILIESYNVILIYIAIELQSYSIYIISSRYNNSYNSSKSGLIYFLLGSLASIIVLIGLVMLYSVTGLTNLYDISIYISTLIDTGILEDNKLILGYMLILIGLLFKIGVAPLHNWLINIYVNVPTIVTIWISIVTKISILTFIYTLLHNTPYIYNISDNKINIIYILSILSVLSMIIGGIGGVSQINIKRVIAYSGLANTGYILYTIICNNQLTLQAYIFNISQYSLTHINWFLILLISIIYYSPINIKESKSLNDKNPISMLYLPTLMSRNKLSKDNNVGNIDIFGYIMMNRYITFSYIVTLASLIGIPPLLGFYGKYYMVISGMYSGYIFSSVILIIVSGITTYYYSFILSKLLPILTNKSNIKLQEKIHNPSGPVVQNPAAAAKTAMLAYSKGVAQQGHNKLIGREISYIICYIISIITFSILFPLLSLDIYTNGSIILDFYQYTIC